MKITNLFEKPKPKPMPDPTNHPCTVDQCEDCALHLCDVWQKIDKMSEEDKKVHFGQVHEIMASGKPAPPAGIFYSKPPSEKVDTPSGEVGCM